MIFETLYDSAKKGELILVDGGLLHYHMRRDGQITIREIIVLPGYQRQGIGSKMLRGLMKCYPEAKSIFAKCPADLPANVWYEKMGFECEGEEETRTGRKVRLWRLRNDGWTL